MGKDHFCVLGGSMMKSIVVIACSKNTSQRCREQLYEILGGHVNIANYYRENLPTRIYANLVVFASEHAFQEGRPCLVRGTAYLIARRAINYDRVEEILHLPAGTNVLLVNDYPSTAEDVIASLQMLGFDYLNYYPYAPGMIDPGVAEVAITPGETELVPPSIEEVINIESRQIDITSVVEILLKLNMMSEYADFLSAKYVRDMIETIKDNFHYKNETIKLKNEKSRLEKSAKKAKTLQSTQATYQFADIRGKSQTLHHALKLAQRFAQSDATVLIQAESGTGKELFAQSIHNASKRAEGPFVAVNLAALTESLMDSELFGYVEGAFTGASRHGAVGLFERANHGTIFLDEIGDAPRSFQIKLLRVLQEKEIRRVGSPIAVPIDVRVIAATNQNLRELVATGKFRQDLYYRLNVLPLTLPPLRERGRDILLLARYFLQQHATMSAVETENWFEYIAKALLQYQWPGNIRELQNVIEYLVNICSYRKPLLKDLPRDLQQFEQQPMVQQEELQQEILQAIQQANEQGKPIGRRSLAAQLQLSESQVRNLLKQLQEKGKICSHRGRSGLTLAE